MEERRDEGQGLPAQESADDLDLEESEGLDLEGSPKDEAASEGQVATAAEGEGEPSEGEPPKDELAEIQAQLQQLLAEKEKQERHAARKITQQSQEIRSRDLEIERLRREIAELKRQQRKLASSSEFDLFGEEEEEPGAELPPQVTERLALYEQALLELNDRLESLMGQQTYHSQLQQIQKELSLPEEYARAYLDAVREGDTVRAAKIVKLAERAQLIKQRRELAQRRQRGAKSQVGATGSSPPKPTTAESIREKLEGMTEWERIEYLAQHPEILEELQSAF